MKDIKDYIHLYIGCQVMDLYNNKIGKLIVVSWKEVLVMHHTQWGLTHGEVKPILRRLSSISDDEVKDLFQYEKIKSMYREIIFERQMWNDVLIGITISYLTGSDEDGWHPQSWTLEFSAMNANDFAWLLSNGFDLFQLIDSNLAIDSSTITENKQ